MIKEIWKDIVGYEKMYKVSSFGNVYSLKSFRMLKPSFRKDGYTRVSLSKNKIVKQLDIHILVSVAFLNHKPNGHLLVIDHINGIKNDNRLDNLRIVTNRENTSICSNIENGRCTSNFIGVSWCKKHSKWRSAILINKKQKHLGYYNNEVDASIAYKNALLKFNIKSTINE